MNDITTAPSPASGIETGTPSVHDHPAHRLCRALRLNATTSVVSGMTMALAPLDRLLETGHPGWVRLVGIGVVLFGLGIAVLTTRPDDQLARWTPAVIAADVAWVIGSVATILLGWYSAGGAVLVGAMAVAVDTFAVLQFRAWRTMTTR